MRTLNSLFLCILFFYSPHLLSAKSEKDSLLLKLEKAIVNKERNEKNKEFAILRIKEALRDESLSIQKKYELNRRISEEYSKYKSDSALFYSLQGIEIARKLNSLELENETNIQLAWLYSTRGMYIESLKLLENIEKNTLSDSLLVKYYQNYSDFYSQYGQSNDQVIYFLESGLYRDSLLFVLPVNSFDHTTVLATKLLYQGENDEAEKILLSLLEKTTDKDPKRALIAYFLGVMYERAGDIENQEKYFIISAIADLENCIKDNASLQSLALTYYELGDINKANRFINLALDDAIFANIRYRAAEGANFYPLISYLFQEKERKKKRILQINFFLICSLSFLLIIGLVHTYKQMKKLSKIRRELRASNLELMNLNLELQHLNENLNESNQIKEKYIAQFFNLCSTYIDKIEGFRRLLNKKAKQNQQTELFQILNSNKIVDNELDELYRHFDKVFLSLYPSFIEDFNSLIVEDQQLFPKNKGSLTTELRIFALIRLGITDSVKIADFLHYSLRTVYNYRTKVRNSASVSRDQFENQVKKIGGFVKKKNEK